MCLLQRCNHIGAIRSLPFPCGLHSFTNNLFGSWNAFSPPCDKWWLVQASWQKTLYWNRNHCTSNTRSRKIPIEIILCKKEGVRRQAEFVVERAGVMHLGRHESGSQVHGVRDVAVLPRRQTCLSRANAQREEGKGPLWLNPGEYPPQWVEEGYWAEWRRQGKQHLAKRDKETAVERLYVGSQGGVCNCAELW